MVSSQLSLTAGNWRRRAGPQSRPIIANRNIYHLANFRQLAKNQPGGALVFTGEFTRDMLESPKLKQNTLVLGGLGCSLRLSAFRFRAMGGLCFWCNDAYLTHPARNCQDYRARVCLVWCLWSGHLDEQPCKGYNAITFDTPHRQAPVSDQSHRPACTLNQGANRVKAADALLLAPFYLTTFIGLCSCLENAAAPRWTSRGDGKGRTRHRSKLCLIKF